MINKDKLIRFYSTETQHNISLMLGGDEEVGRRVRVRLAGLEDDLGAGHGGAAVDDGRLLIS